MTSNLIPPIVVTDFRSPVSEQPLFAEDIIEKACDFVRSSFVGRAVNPKSVVLQIERMIYEAFVRQAEYRGVEIYSLKKLINQINIEISDPQPINITIHVPTGLLDELNEHLHNRICHVCKMKVPGGVSHGREECDAHLVEDVMAE